MEIQAKLYFRHGAIMRIIDSAGISIKQLSFMCGWDYQNLLSFISFKYLPKSENKKSLINVLKNIDSSINYSDIFPTQYNKIRIAFKARISTKEIPIEKLLPLTDTLLIENKEDNYLDEIDFNRLNNEIRKKISDYEMKIISLYFGINGNREHTLEEVGEKLKITRERTRLIKDRAIEKLRKKPEIKKFVDIGMLSENSF
jgi:hypothetical protein